jgi:hypothetical protein
VLLLCACILFVLRSGGLASAAKDPLFHVYAISILAIFLLPDNVNAGQFSSGGYIGLRLSFFAAIAGAAVLARHVRSNLFFWSTAAIAILFFALLYRDGRSVEQVTRSLAAQTASLSGTPRVSALVKFPEYLLEPALAKPLRRPGLRQMQLLLYDENFGINIAHIIDVACIGQCISYGNYEPSTYQFRVRPLPGNRFAPTEGSVAAKIEQGLYTVQESDMPMYSIYVCGPEVSDFCTRPLKAGETNGYPAK